MKLHERGSWLFYIIIFGALTGWFSSDDDTKEKVKTMAADTTRTVVEQVEKHAASTKSKEEEPTLRAEETVSHVDVARLKDLFTSAVYSTAVNEFSKGEGEPTLKQIWATVQLNIIEEHGEDAAMQIILREWQHDNAAIVDFGGERFVVNYVQSVGMIANIEPIGE